MPTDLSCVPGFPDGCLDDAGRAIGDAASGLAGDVVGNSFAEAMREGATWVIKTTIGWWIDVPAIDIASSPADTIRGYVLWLAIVVAAGGVMWQGLVMVLSRRPEPAFAVGRGLFTIAFWSAVGIVGPAAALRAGDSFSSWVLDEAAHGQATDRLVKLAGLGGVSSPGAVILLGLVMMLAGLVQAVLMMFREAAVIVLAGVVVLAAAGTFTRATRPWLPRVLGWMLALICYKPAAALVYASAITLVGEGDDPRTVVVGLTMMLLAVVALPVLMRFFTWTTGAASGSGGGLAALAGASAAGIHASVALTGVPGRAAALQADQVRGDLGSGTASGGVPSSRPGPEAGGGGTGASGAGTGTRPGPGTGYGPGGAAAGSSTSASMPGTPGAESDAGTSGAGTAGTPSAVGTALGGSASGPGAPGAGAGTPMTGLASARGATGAGAGAAGASASASSAGAGAGGAAGAGAAGAGSAGDVGAGPAGAGAVVAAQAAGQAAQAARSAAEQVGDATGRPDSPTDPTASGEEADR